MVSINATRERNILASSAALPGGRLSRCHAKSSQCAKRDLSSRVYELNSSLGSFTFTKIRADLRGTTRAARWTNNRV